MKAGNRIRVLAGLALVASLVGLLWRLERAPQLKRSVNPERHRRIVTRPTSPPPGVDPSDTVSTGSLRYDLPSDQKVWGSLSLLPGFWGYASRVELPEVSPRSFLVRQLGEELEEMLPTLTVIRRTTDWGEFLGRWVDPRLSRTTGLGFFNPNVTYEGLRLLPAAKQPDFGLGLKYRWSF